MKEMKEEWKYIEGFGNRYMVSNTGKVKSMNYNKQGYEKELKPFINPDGYKIVCLNRNTCRVNRLVAQAFIPNLNNLPEVNHIDTDRTNDNVWNLEWSTHEDNIKHSAKLGHYKGKFGKDNPNYGNDTLHKRYMEDKEFAKEKQSRPAEQNGRATPIKMYDIDMNLIKEFTYMKQCFQYIIDNGYVTTKNPESLRSKINSCIKNNKPYKNMFYFEKQ